MQQHDKDFLEAADNQDREALEAAVAAGADVTVKGESGMNALGIAVTYGNLGMADYLASVGAPVTSDVMAMARMTQFDTTPRMLQLLEGWQFRQMEPDVKKLKKVDKALVLASAKGDQSAIREAIDAGAKIDVLDGYDTTPLRWAIRKGQHEAVPFLLEAGADVNHESASGWTPLMEAGASGEAEMVEVLLNAGAVASFKNRSGQDAEAVTRYGGFDALADRIARAT